MRIEARLARLPGYRFTGTLTRPNVSVPDQNGRAAVVASSSRLRLVALRVAMLAFAPN